MNNVSILWGICGLSIGYGIVWPELSPRLWLLAAAIAIYLRVWP